MNTVFENTEHYGTHFPPEQEEYALRVQKILSDRAKAEDKKPGAFIVTFGCQQNEADSERLMGQAVLLGYRRVTCAEDADLILYNTCAVREHAELRALSRTGALKHLKSQNKNLLIGLWGCMVTQDHRMQDVKMKYPYVDFVAGTNMLHRLPEILCDVLESGRRRYYVTNDPPQTVEDVPVLRENDIKAYVSILYGCNNFCTYCVVPYVRGRERSRDPEAVIREVEGLVQSGCRDITLLGQNVNSYAPAGGMNFASLLRRLAEIPGDFRLRFMTSHPKDASDELIEVMAENEKIARHFHLPMQSGSTEILRRMNRKYTAESYLALAEKIKKRIPDITLTTDIIVGFPGETEKDFEDTFSMVERLRFDSVFSFIFSPRVGTPAADMEDDTPHEEKTARMNRLLKRQADIAAEDHAKLVGKTLSVLCESKEPNENGLYLGRTSGNLLVFFESGAQKGALYGQFVPVRITASGAANLSGKAEE